MQIFPPLHRIKSVNIEPTSEHYPLKGFGGIPLGKDYILGNEFGLDTLDSQDYRTAKWCYEHSEDLTLTYKLKD